MAVLQVTAQAQRPGHPPVGIEHGGEGLTLSVGLHLPPVERHFGISCGLCQLGHESEQVGPAVGQRVAPQVARHAFHHEGPWHDARSHVPAVAVVVAVIQGGQHLVAAQVLNHGLIPHGAPLEHVLAVEHRDAQLGSQAGEGDGLVGCEIVVAALAVLKHHAGVNAPFHLLGCKGWNGEQ